MHISGKESYAISMGDPQPLQFAAYIALQEGYDLSITSQPTSQAEIEWKEWWLALPAMYAERMAHFQEAIKSSPLPFDSTLLQKANPSNYGFNPPDFSSMPEDSADLKGLCLKHWPQFLIWSHPEQQKFLKGMKKFNERIGLHQLIKEIENANGREANPFKLRVDFVYWPENYLRFVSENYVVLTALNGNPERETAFKELLRSQIGKLA